VCLQSVQSACSRLGVCLAADLPSISLQRLSGFLHINIMPGAATSQAVDQIYESDEEPTPKPTMLGTVTRMFSRNRGEPAHGTGRVLGAGRSGARALKVMLRGQAAATCWPVGARIFAFAAVSRRLCWFPTKCHEATVPCLLSCSTERHATAVHCSTAARDLRVGCCCRAVGARMGGGWLKSPLEATGDVPVVGVINYTPCRGSALMPSVLLLAAAPAPAPVCSTPLPTAPTCTPDPGEVATIDRELSISSLRRRLVPLLLCFTRDACMQHWWHGRLPGVSDQPGALTWPRCSYVATLATVLLRAPASCLCLPVLRCKRLLVERDQARAEGFAEAALAVEQSVEIDKLSECCCSAHRMPAHCCICRS